MRRSQVAGHGLAGVAAVCFWLVASGESPVSGSAPAPERRTVAVLESQREWRFASDLASEGDGTLARVRLAALRGDFAAALAGLAATFPEVPQGSVALARAAYHFRLGAPDSTRAILAALVPPEGLTDYAAFLAADAAASSGDWQAAARGAERARTERLPGEFNQRLLVVRAQAARARGDEATLAALSPELGEAARRDDRTGLLLFELARGADSLRARTWLLELLEARPTPAESAYALLTRTAAGGTATALRLARYEARSGRHDACRARVRRALQASLPARTRAELLLVLADSQLRTAEYSACLQTLARAAAPASGTPLEVERLRTRARAERRSGQPRSAMRTYREIARRFPSDALADDALYEVGWLHENLGALGDAERAYVRCRRTYPKGSLADDADLRAGLAALRDARPRDAVTHLAPFASRHPRSSLVDNALYWQLLAKERLGDAAGAGTLRERLANDFPRSWFTVLAQRALTRSDTASTGQPQAAGADSGFARAARADRAWLAALAELRAADFRVPADYATQSRQWRFFLDFGLAPEALAEARRLERLYGDSPGALVEMIATAHVRGATERLVRWAHLLGQQAGEPARAAILVLSYPAPFSVSLAEIAPRNQLSHAAVLGLMRQESAFDPAIDSGVGARGLMQLMPAVGQRLWQDAGRGDLHPDDLYRPEVNVELGCQLLRAEMERARGDLAQALAAYNAGGDQAESWAKRLGAGDPPEMYVDLVEYAETRNYLKTVLGNIEVYRRLYALP